MSSKGQGVGNWVGLPSVGVFMVASLMAVACGEASSRGKSDDDKALGSASAKSTSAAREERAQAQANEQDSIDDLMASGSPEAANLTYGHGNGAGTGQGYGNGAAVKRRVASPPPAAATAGGRADADENKKAAVSTVTDQVLDPNGRYATTYRPGGGHLAAFESAVAQGIVPEADKEIVSDIGARYAPTIDAPTKSALAFQNDFERTKLAPSGGPVHVRLTLRSTVAAPTERPPLAVVVVLDVSGSMRGELIKSARDAASQLVDKLGDKDQFSLVTFSTDAQVRIPLKTIGAKRDDVKKVIADVVEGGGTNIGEGLNLGYTEAQKKEVNADAVRVVMLLSDGRANDGITNRRALSAIALHAFESGIQTSSFGLGVDYDGPLMSQIANNGAGGYYYLPNGNQIAPALTTELQKRLDPVATAVEVRVRLRPGVELLNVYGSRRLTAEESASVRAIEVAQDKQTETRDKIKANRQEDNEGGMRFFIPAFARDDNHSMLLKLRIPEGVGLKDVALVEVKYKDRVTKKNVAEEFPLKVEYAVSDVESAGTISDNMRRTVQGFAAGESLTKAAQLIADGQKQAAIDLLGEREGLLMHAAAILGEPLFVRDAARLSRLRTYAAGKNQLSEPLVLAMMMETAGGAHLH